MIKANRLAEIAQATQFNVPVDPDHDFFTNFEGLRGDYGDSIIYESLNVTLDGEKLTFNPSINKRNKAILFLSGMRGSGKTSEVK